MGAKLRVYTQKIKSAQTTKKITKAMELIAASRIQKALARVEASSPYARALTRAVSAVATYSNEGHPLTTEREQIKRSAVIVLTSDRGLAGAYNANVLRRGERTMRANERDGKQSAVVTSGRKALAYFRYRGFNIVESYTGYAEQPSYEDARRLGQAMMTRYQEGEIDQVELIYTRFLSIGTQRVQVTRLLPMEREEIEEAARGGADGHDGPQAQYEIEPDPDTQMNPDPGGMQMPGPTPTPTPTPNGQRIRGGCTAAPAVPLALLAGLLLRRARRRQSRAS